MVSLHDDERRRIGSIGDRATFGRFRAEGAVGRAGGLTVVVLDPAPGDPERHRAAFAISRRVGSAVARNRLRRRLRVALGHLVASGALPAGDYLVVPRPNTVGQRVTTLRGWLAEATDRARSNAERAS